jgi:hypothetical protein
VDIAAITVGARDILIIPENNGFKFFVAFFTSVFVDGHYFHLLSYLWYRKKSGLQTFNEVILFAGSVREPEGLFRTLSHSALGTLLRHGRLFGVYASGSLALSNGNP